MQLLVVKLAHLHQYMIHTRPMYKVNTALIALVVAELCVTAAPCLCIRQA